MNTADPQSARSPSYLGVRMLLLLLLLPGFAFADKMASPEKVEIVSLPLKAEENPFVPDPMRRATPWPVPPPAAEGDEAVEAPPGANEVVPGRLGSGPWRLFESTFPEDSCRAPRLNEDAGVAIALCSGMDVSRPEDEHIVLVRENKLVRYRAAVAPVAGSATVDLSPSGDRFAVVVQEAGGGHSVHLVNLERGTDTRVSGGWRNPGNAVVAGDSEVVAFNAQVGRDEALVVVNLTTGVAQVAERSPTPARIFGLDSSGRRVLYSVKVHGHDFLRLVDLDRGTRLQVSNVKSGITGAWMDRDIDSVAWAAEIGGLCGLYWGNANSRKRVELRSELEGCFNVLGISDGGREILYAETRRSGDVYKIWDRKAKADRYEVIAGCVEPSLSYDGSIMAVRCPRARKGPGVYLFKIPEPED